MKPKLKLTILVMALGALGLLVAAGANAQLGPPPPLPPAMFDMTGFIQEATLDGTVGGLAAAAPADPLLAGGTMTLNGIKMYVPNNSIVQMPAASFTWAQLFDPAVSALLGQTAGQTGLALIDTISGAVPPAPFPSFEVRVIGNIVQPTVTGTTTPDLTQPPRYIVGLIVPISQELFNAGQGIINWIDPVTGRFRVGGIINDSTTGALCEINDPVGRFGPVHSPDNRFTADTNNPTIAATTGYPVGAPVGAERPATNRPLNNPASVDPNQPFDPFLAVNAPLRTWTMPAAATAGSPDPTKQVPLMVGDFVTYTGTLVKIDRTLPAFAANSYVSVHTLDADLGVYTQPGVQPCYVRVEVLLIGTGGAPVSGGNPLTAIGQEATTRLTVVGFTTDPSRAVDIYAVDVNPCTGAETFRFLTTGTPRTLAPLGRFDIRLLGGLFTPPTREVIAISRTGELDGPGSGGILPALKSGTFRLPNFDYIPPEHLIIGNPVIPANFQDWPFLAQGSGPLNGVGPVVGQLDPWPGFPVPPKATCGVGGFAPIVSASSPSTVASGAQVTLTGTVTLDPNSVGAQILWAQTAGPVVTLTGANTLTPSFTAPFVAPGSSATLTFTLTVTDNFGSGQAFVTVTVLPASDIVTITGATWRNQKGGKLTVTATSSDPTAVLELFYTVAATGVTVDAGTMSATIPPVPGSYTFTGTGIPQPSSVRVQSSKGGQATSGVTIR